MSTYLLNPRQLSKNTIYPIFYPNQTRGLVRQNTMNGMNTGAPSPDLNMPQFPIKHTIGRN